MLRALCVGNDAGGSHITVAAMSGGAGAHTRRAASYVTLLLQSAMQWQLGAHACGDAARSSQ